MSKKRIVEFEEGVKYKDPFRSKNEQESKITLEDCGSSFVDLDIETDKNLDCSVPKYISSGLPEINKDSPVEMESGVRNISIERISKHFGWSLNYTRIMVLTHGCGVVIPSGEEKLLLLSSIFGL